MDYNFRDIELKWQKNWKESSIYKIEIDNSKPKFYILDMFPYPSGSGLHVGHPLGYIATDIYGRYKRQKGYNVLHPMGFDAFGLPAEQWAITTGRHPADTTDENIKRYKEQLELIGLGYDWSREIRTSDPKFYKWTQWIFIKLFHSWFDNNANKARPIESLIEAFEKDGNITINAAVEKDSEEFTSNEWKTKDYKAQQKILSSYRLAYLAFAEVNWCPELGTVLANEEVQTDPVKGLVSERGGYPVERKPMNQWFLRITAYSERLITEMDEVDFPDSIREMQKNWIGRSDGAMIDFAIKGSNKIIPVFTTRPDTIYGATYMVLAPEHELVQEVLAEERRDKVEKYIQYTSTRSEKDRMAEIKNITGEFTGGYAINPFTKEEIPIWVAEYVLAGYGSGAIMAVPAHDTRDHAFAKHFELEIRPVVEGGNIEEEALEDKSGKHINSDIINGMEVDQATQTIIDKVVEMGIGEHQVNYKLRDFLFSRQRYWGEPFPIVYKKGIPETVPLEDLPVLLPNMYDFQPTGTGEAPLAKESDWVDLPDGKTRETNTMPGWAGSNWYFIRYLDPHNEKEIISGEVEGYWKNVDLYVGGAEHATGHLIYSRFIYKFLSDLGIVSEKEPYKKLINQGMILGYSHYINVSWDEKIAYSANITKDEEKDVKGLVKFRIPIEYVDIDGNFDLDKLEDFKKEFPEFDTVEFKDKGGVFHIAEKSMDKMSKSLRNVVNPDEIIEEFGADTFRMYEMFLGPIEQSKPWDTKGIEGTSRFLHKFWRLFFNEQGKLAVEEGEASDEEKKIYHKCIKKVSEDIERFSFNTGVSTFMICINELSKIKSNNKAILEGLVIALASYAPHISEELWQLLGHQSSVVDAAYPEVDEKYVTEDSFEYPIAINGKTRTKMVFPVDMNSEDIEKEVLSDKVLAKWLEGKTIKKVIVVPKRIVNVVI